MPGRRWDSLELVCLPCALAEFHLLFWQTQTRNWKHFEDQTDRMLRDMETGHPRRPSLDHVDRNSEGEEKNLLWGSDTNRRNCTWRSSNRGPWDSQITGGLAVKPDWAAGLGFDRNKNMEFSWEDNMRQRRIKVEF